MSLSSVIRSAARHRGPAQTWGFQRGMSSAVATSDNRVSVKVNGRQSSSGITATVFGASGFLGRYVVSRLGRIGSRIVIPYRGDGMLVRHLKPMADLGGMNFIPLDMCDEETIRESVKNSNVIINLVGSRHQTNNYNYDDTHVKCTHRIAKICAEMPDIKRVIHVSALGADVNSSSEFLASKARGEEAMKAYFPNATIIRPAPVFGNEDYLLNQIADQINQNLVVPIVGNGEQKLQPVYVQDLAQGIVNCIVDSEAPGQTYHAVGPEVISRNDLFNFIKDDICLPEARMIPIPEKVCRFLGQLAEKFVPAYQRNLNPDYVDQLKYDLVQPKNVKTLAELGITKLASIKKEGRVALLVHRGARVPDHFDWENAHAKRFGGVEEFGSANNSLIGGK